MLTHRSDAIRARLCRASGFTLIELMVVVAIMAIAASLAGPGFRQALANYRVRSAAESMMTGLNLARAEAVKRNSPVTFTLNAVGSGWTIAQVAPATVIQGRSDGDSPGVTTASSTSSRIATFLPTGQVDTTAVRLSQLTVSSTAPNSETRRIDIFGGGLTRMCDPSVATSNDPKRC